MKFIVDIVDKTNEILLQTELNKNYFKHFVSKQR